MTDSAPVVVADDLSIHYRSRDLRSRYLAVDGVSFSLQRGEILGLVGETGSGKSTLAAAIGAGNDESIFGPEAPEICGGSLLVLGTEMRGLSVWRRDHHALKVGYLPQDGAQRLDSRLTVAENVAEPIFSRDRKFSSREAGAAVATLVDSLRLPLGLMSRYPYELSSGQRQRVALARALILEPELLVADEPTRGVDVTVRSEVLSVIRDMKDEKGLSALILSSDLRVIESVSEQILVMVRGTVVGLGPINGVLDDPIDPYLKALSASRFDKVGA